MEGQGWVGWNFPSTSEPERWEWNYTKIKGKATSVFDSGVFGSFPA